MGAGCKILQKSCQKLGNKKFQNNLTKANQETKRGKKNLTPSTWGSSETLTDDLA